MRRNVLVRSVQRLVPGAAVIDVAYMWVRHRSALLYAVGAFVALVVVAALAGFDQWPSRIGIGIAGAAVATSATTDYRVLAHTDRGLVLLVGGRVRQIARRVIRDLPADAEIEIVRDTMLTTDWTIDGIEYTVPKSSQRAVERMSAR